jgi:hypothetical protein
MFFPKNPGKMAYNLLYIRSRHTPAFPNRLALSLPNPRTLGDHRREERAPGTRLAFGVFKTDAEVRGFAAVPAVKVETSRFRLVKRKKGSSSPVAGAFISSRLLPVAPSTVAPPVDPESRTTSQTCAPDDPQWQSK